MSQPSGPNSSDRLARILDGLSPELKTAILNNPDADPTSLRRQMSPEQLAKLQARVKDASVKASTPKGLLLKEATGTNSKSPDSSAKAVKVM